MTQREPLTRTGEEAERTTPTQIESSTSSDGGRGIPTTRDIEKLRAIGYKVEFEFGKWWASHPTYPAVKGRFADYRPRSHIQEPQRTTEALDWAWEACLQHSKQPHILKATMADKVRWLTVRFGWTFTVGYDQGRFVVDFADAGEGEGDSPEAAVDALFRAVQ